jgi:hypothetical protein
MKLIGLRADSKKKHLHIKIQKNVILETFIGGEKYG